MNDMSEVKETERTSANGQQFIVEKIVSRRVRKGRVEYFIKWQSFEESDYTCEPTENLFCGEMIKTYEENRCYLPKKLQETRTSLSLRSRGRRHSIAIAEVENHQNNNESIQMAKTRSRRKSQHELIEKDQPKKTTNNKINRHLKEKNKLAPAVVTVAKTNNTTESKAHDNASSENITSTEQKEATITVESHEPTSNGKSLASSKQSWELNGTKLVSDFLTRHPKPKTGFERGLVPEQIIGVAKFNDNLYLVIKFQGDDEPHMINNEVANKEIPQMIIKFYEKSLYWQSDN